ncbi:secreted RxLR effector peptide protein, putative [Phytophthora infestans T30-4]|uniref:Secreted RxLR effector peptide protein, putative n=1 Tax=Phytophthora infestans (strain T30-4) TaxID=403677 RepID=D0P1R2_PHYIT|nr:secreted RxLR effector peptide protein, putative [Phytophthora infestans T30-4]EEY54697.1 secreted RxLR effector peptide protein, putative [Phytophthora infestans T30-4]|eukprot:XP_002895766.1 secreted RxLR effector peptide protein, putative [Phytophthora infestans T30-4]
MCLADYIRRPLVITLLVITICDTTSAIADTATEQTSFADDASIDAVPLFPAGHHDSAIMAAMVIDMTRQNRFVEVYTLYRLLRSDSTTAEAHKTSATDEEREIILATVDSDQKTGDKR